MIQEVDKQAAKAERRKQANLVIATLACAARKFVEVYESEGPKGETTGQAVERAANVALQFAFDSVDNIMTESGD